MLRHQSRLSLCMHEFSAILLVVDHDIRGWTIDHSSWLSVSCHYRSRNEDGRSSLLVMFHESRKTRAVSSRHLDLGHLVYRIGKEHTIMFLITMLRRVFAFGTIKEPVPKATKRIRLLNGICFFGVVVVLVAALLNILMLTVDLDDTIVTALKLDFVLVVSLLTCMFLNARGLYTASCYLIISLLIVVFSLAMTLGHVAYLEPAFLVTFVSNYLA